MSGAQYPRADWIPHNHYWPGRQKHTIRYIIIHAVAGAYSSAADTAEQYRRGKADIGPHYIVDRAGRIVQCVREENAAWSNGAVTAGFDTWWGSRGNPNLETLSVEFVKTRGDHSDAITRAQIEAGFLLIAHLMRKWQIPPRWADSAGGITGHFSIDPVNAKYDPGPFPWDELFHSLLAPAERPVSHITYAAAPTRNPAMRSNGLPEQPGARGGATATAPSSAKADAKTEAMTVGERAHAALQDAPGFAGIVAATNEAEQFQGLTVKGLGDIPNWLAANGLALLVRLALIGLGLALVVALLWSLVRRNSWMKDAGGDLIPLAFANASATGDSAGQGSSQGGEAA
jgi:N-acetyl-anhydromuramyl-L-alanine amidase AmpD